MNLWKRLLKLFREEADQQRTFALDLQLEQSLRQLAMQEKRPPEEILQVLIEAGLQHHRQNEAAWQQWKSLTPREQEVAALVCLGYTNRQIADHLTISPHTAGHHVRHIYDKLGVSSRAAATQAATSGGSAGSAAGAGDGARLWGADGAGSAPSTLDPQAPQKRAPDSSSAPHLHLGLEADFPHLLQKFCPAASSALQCGQYEGWGLENLASMAESIRLRD